MKTAYSVIGAGYGDEGKGLTTDHYAARFAGNALVVRYNGGAQAGHTVATPQGQRHVFSHFGSGSFAGAPTFLSQFFVCNPLLFMKELALLHDKAVTPAVRVAAGAPVTTPYDMMINQIAEEARGATRHGSCGMGFGETIERCEPGNPALFYADLADAAALKQKLGVIRKEWVPKRLAALGIQNIPSLWQERIGAEGVLQKFMDDTAAFLQVAQPAAPDYLATTPAMIIFEGAQGLLLDQVRGTFPHVTRSHTGIKNILALAAAAEIDSIDATYITRAYLTRHGAGPLAGELQQAPYAGIEDKTNITNTYQGSLRFAHLDIAHLQKTIEGDLSDRNLGIKLRVGLMVSCLDQLDDVVQYADDYTLAETTPEGLVAALQSRLAPDFMLTSHGPTRATIHSL
ncbi:MAG: adenylosuccinate synthetase [Micavibrio sp.]|nr:adenylosuccinate synthetase [Micavibrio sp.]